MTPEQAVYEAGLRLSPQSRSRVIRKLASTLKITQALDEAIQEAEREWNDYRAGKIKGVQAKKLFPGLAKPRAKRRGTRSSS